MTRGVSKSGSPTPRLMTSSMVARMSKKRRIPDGGAASTGWAGAASAKGARAVWAVIDGKRTRRGSGAPGRSAGAAARHEPQHRIQEVRGEGRRLPGGVIGRDHFDHVEAHELDARETPHDGQHVVRRRAAGLGRAGAGREGRI